MAITLSSSNQSYLDRIKTDISSKKNWESIRTNALSQLDRRLASNELSKDQYDYLKSQISNAGKKLEPTVNTIDNKQELLQSTKDLTLDQRKTVMEQQAQSYPSVTDKQNIQPSIGWTSTENPNTKQFDETGLAYEENAKKMATDTANSAMDRAKQEQAVIQQRDADKLARSSNQEQKLKTIEDRANKNFQNRRDDAEELLAQQNYIAEKNANITAAQASQSWLALSQSEVDSIRNDTIAKYGQNIANAMDYKNKTNMTIDEALTRTGLDIFNKQAEIDKFKDALTDAEFAPILNAVQKAAEWDKKAIDDVYTFYQKYADKKAEEEYNRVAKTERYIAEENQFATADSAMKERIIFEQLQWWPNTPATPWFQYIIQNVPWIIARYPTASMTFVLGTAMEEAMNNTNTRQILLAMASNWTIKDPTVLELINKNNASITKTEWGALDRSTQVVEPNKQEVAKAQEQNPGTTYNNPQSTPAESSYGTTYKFSEANQKFIDTWAPRIKSDPTKKKNALNVLDNARWVMKLTDVQYNAIRNALGI